MESYETLIDVNQQSQGGIWRAFHSISFVTGGVSFIIGTALLFPSPSTYLLSLLSAIIYTIGSVGFLAVDIQEFFTFTDDNLLRLNISISATGSLAYVIGSLGYIPSIESDYPLLGIVGFILGSLLIFCSQLWKLCRIGWPFKNKDTLTASLVEGGACLGGLFFLIGSVLVVLIPNNDANVWVLVLWLIGSISFTIGGFSLSYRHFVLNL